MARKNIINQINRSRKGSRIRPGYSKTLYLCSLL